MSTLRLVCSLALLLGTGFLLGAGSDPAPTEPDLETPNIEANAEHATEGVAEHLADDIPTVIEPLPFDHSTHDKPFDRFGLSCADCHPLGLTSESTDVEMLPAPRSVCHACHRGELKGAPRRASDRCSACHPVRDELKPESHNLGWSKEHGPEAQALRNGCDTCHDRGQCIDCHEARGAMTRSPHGPGFRSFHGVDARIDGASCVRCHASETCLQCHEGGKRPW